MANSETKRKTVFSLTSALLPLRVFITAFDENIYHTTKGRYKCQSDFLPRLVRKVEHCPDWYKIYDINRCRVLAVCFITKKV